MKDAELSGLMETAMALPFPPDCGGVDIRGVELALLDGDIYGVAGHYNRNRRSLTEEHRTLLGQLVVDIDRIREVLPNEEARRYFDAYRDIATHLLSDRARQ